jgi:hypothetical protein
LMAALIGQAFSKTKNVTIGVATDIDENRLFEKPTPKRQTGTAGRAGAANEPATDNTSASELVPWVKLEP